MKRFQVSYTISLLLLVMITITGLTGFIQSQLELRNFRPHIYSCYTTLSLASLHVWLNWKKIKNFPFGKLKGGSNRESGEEAEQYSN